jgi:hypothetical protein
MRSTTLLHPAMTALIRQLADAVCDDLEAEAAANETVQPSDPAKLLDAPRNPCTDSNRRS